MTNPAARSVRVIVGTSPGSPSASEVILEAIESVDLPLFLQRGAVYRGVSMLRQSEITAWIIVQAGRPN